MTFSPGVLRVPTGLDGVTARRVPRPGGDELFVTAALGGARSAAQTWERVQRLLEAQGATALSLEVFGRSAAEYRALAPHTADVPSTLVCGSTEGAPLGGLLVWATTAPGVETLRADGRVIGRRFQDGEVEWCRLGDLRPSPPLGSSALQARATLAMMAGQLERAGLSFSNTLRTWFFNEDILAWYGDFNRERTSFFTERRVFDGLVPASTGIGGKNPAGTALVAGLLALRPLAAGVSVSALPSPLQCAALQYGSSFSRAVEVRTPTHRRVTVSGTASIEPGGKSVHLGDVRAQIELTLRVVLAILESRGLGFGDVVHGVAYLRDRKDAASWATALAEHHLEELPVVTTENVVCRDDLLFELEVDALSAAP